MESIIGLPLVAGLKNMDEDAILVDAGDTTQGLPLASLTKGNDVIQLMNQAGYDLMTAGNHEFDFGTDAFLKNVSLAQFPVLAANIYKDGKLLLAGTQEETDGCHVIIERKGKKIGFFGLTTTATASATNPEDIQGVTFTDEIETAKAEIGHLEEAGADVVIVVAHMGDTTGGAPCTSEDLANAMTGAYQGKLDAIIDEHSHTQENENINDVQIVQTGTGLTSVGKMTISVGSESKPEVTEELLKMEDFADVTPDAELGSRVVSITLDGQSTSLDRTDDTTQIIMASNNYIMSGGNDYTMLAELPKYAEAGGELETIESYIKSRLENNTLMDYQGIKGRIAYTGSVYQPKNYNVSVKIVDADGNTCADQEISYRIDGGDGQMGRTDGNGILHITVSDGGHGIRVSDSQDEVYVDNYAGIGIVEDALRTIPQLTAPEPGSEIPVNSTEEPSEPQDPGSGAAARKMIRKNRQPKTGDEAPVEAAGAAAILSLAVIVAMFGTKAKRK